MANAYDVYAAKHGAPDPPPGHQRIEQQARDYVVAEALPSNRKQPIDDITIEDVQLIGEFPRTRVVVLFRWDRYPGMRLGRARSVWNPDGSYDRWSVHDLMMFLALELRTIRRDLEIKPDGQGVGWI